MERFDVVVLGAGAAGMMAAIEAGRRGRRVLVLDHARAAGEKIRISGGGRCNFTNREAARGERFISEDLRFALSALRRFRPEAIIARLEAAGIAWHEKHLGQLFCDGSARQVVDWLLAEMAAAGVELRLGVEVGAVEAGFRVGLASGGVEADSLVVATGGKSIPKMGATDLGYRLARQFGMRVVEPRPGLVPFVLAEGATEGLAGIALPHAAVEVPGARFEDSVLFTHRGLSGPGMLQASSYWREGEAVRLDLCLGEDVAAVLRAARGEAPKAALRTALGRVLPERLARRMEAEAGVEGPIGALSNAVLERVAGLLRGWEVKPVGTEGYRTAEVTVGGVDTAGLDGRTMAARAVPGLYFVGEVVDVTGWLGGYNFQWAWASGWAAGQVA